MEWNHTIRAAILGHAVGDALGVPVEFQTRDELAAHPVTRMMGYGSYDVPAGSYRECVLRAVNLGSDTDTVAAVAGGLAGILYGYGAIPREWLDGLIRRPSIEKLCDTFARNVSRHSRPL